MADSASFARHTAATKISLAYSKRAISKTGSKDCQLRRPERELSLSGANITISQQADQLRCPLFHASLVARCFTENQLSPFCWH
jgi:hypothetical protein